MSLYDFDRQYQASYQLIAGIDEAGRGPLAGPVVASAVILGLNSPIIGINDSKKLSEKKREFLYDQIMTHAISVGVGIVDNNIIDDINILNATKKAMLLSLEKLERKPDFLLIDAVKLDQSPYPYEPIIKGDTLSASIAAASIIAKVTRDRIMKKIDETYPDYCFSKHKGYPTKEHLRILNEIGCCPIHRKSYKPVRDAIEKRK